MKNRNHDLQTFLGQAHEKLQQERGEVSGNTESSKTGSVLKKRIAKTRNLSDQLISQNLPTIIEEMLKNGMKIPEILEKTHISKKILFQISEKALFDLIYDLHINQGYSGSDIAKNLQVHRTTINRFLIKKGIKEKITASKAEECKELFRNGEKVASIALKVNLSIKHVVIILKELLLLQITDMYIQQNMSVEKIAVILKLSSSTIRSWLIENGIKKTNKERLLSKDIKNSIIKKYLGLEGIRKISDELHVSPGIIKKVIKEHKIMTLDSSTRLTINNHLIHHQNITVTREIEELIIGEMLGDGSIINRNKKSNIYSITEILGALNTYKKVFQFLENENLEEGINAYNSILDIVQTLQTAWFSKHQSIIEEIWVLKLEEIINKNGFETSITYSHQETGDLIYLLTKSTIQLNFLWEKWYKNNKKIVPKDFALTPAILLYWYLGDGAFQHKKILYLYTNDFTINDCQHLIVLLKNIGIEAKIRMQYEKRTDKNYPIIVIRKHSNNDFFNYMKKASLYEFGKKNFPWKFEGEMTKRHFLELFGNKCKCKERIKKSHFF